MANPENCRVFVGGLSWDTSDKRLEQAFRRFGKVLDAKVMIDKDTGRPRGFGFVTFGDEESMEEAIASLHNAELDGRIISVNKARGGRDYGYENSYDSGGGRAGFGRGGISGGGFGGCGGGFGRRGSSFGGGSSYGGGGSTGNDKCFNCGKLGHWARDCPYGEGDGARGPSRFSGSSGGGGSGRNEQYGGGPSFGSNKYGGDDRYGAGDRYGPGRYSDSGGASGRGYGRGGSVRGNYARGSDRYGSGGPARFDRGFRDRPGPYGRPSGRSAYDDHY